jgi:hypothetical protein
MLNRLNGWVCGAMCVLALLTLSVSGEAADGTMTWKGSYGYLDNLAPVPFTLTFTTKGKGISGRVVEPATFGDGSSDKLIANIAGTSSGYEVAFTKTYDGTGGQTHSVQYRGAVDGNTMYGVWQLGDGTSGAWYARKQPN